MKASPKLVLMIIFCLLLACFSVYSFINYNWILTTFLVLFTNSTYHLIRKGLKKKENLFYVELLQLFLITVWILGFSLSKQYLKPYLMFISPLVIFNQYLFLQTNAAVIKEKPKKKVEFFGIFKQEHHLALLSLLYIRPFPSPRMTDSR